MRLPKTDCAIRRQHGDDAVGIYFGNPTVHNYGALIFQHVLKYSLRSKNNFSASSVDQRPHHFVANQMFGHGLLIPIPDIDRTNHMMILGANPAVSNGSLMTAPDIIKRLHAIRQRGRLVLIDPRASETSRLVDEHHFIRPGADVYFLAAMLHVIFARELTRLDQQHQYVKNVDLLKRAVESFSPDSVAEVTGIPAATIERLAVDFATTDHAVVYGRIGVSTQPYGGVCNWLINAINLVTGNLDRQGGQMFTTPAFPLVGRHGTREQIGRWHSRVRGLPEFEGELPVAVLAEEILTPGAGQIRALVTNAGNPVLSTPNGQQLDTALASLDFFVAIDIYINETNQHADLILPPAAGLETEHYDLAFNALAIRNVARYSRPTFKPSPDALYDWQIMSELARRWLPEAGGLASAVQRKLTLAAMSWITPKRFLNLGLLLGPYGACRWPFRGGLNLRRLEAAEHGIDLGELQPRLPKALRTSDRKIDAAPTLLLDRLVELGVKLGSSQKEHSTTSPHSFLLIGRRNLRSNNSWMHHIKRLTKGPNRCTLQMHSRDAERLKLRHGEEVVARSRVGEVKIPLEVTDTIMPGVVSIPHGYGQHRQGTNEPPAVAFAGVSINDLTDDQIVDTITGNAAFSGQRVIVARASDDAE